MHTSVESLGWNSCTKRMPWPPLTHQQSANMVSAYPSFCISHCHKFLPCCAWTCWEIEPSSLRHSYRGIDLIQRLDCALSLFHYISVPVEKKFPFLYLPSSSFILKMVTGIRRQNTVREQSILRWVAESYHNLIKIYRCIQSINLTFWVGQGWIAQMRESRCRGLLWNTRNGNWSYFKGAPYEHRSLWKKGQGKILLVSQMLLTNSPEVSFEDPRASYPCHTSLILKALGI